MAQDLLTEGPVIRAVAETARDNGDQGPAGPEQGQGERDKGRIEIDRFDPCVTQQSPVGGMAADFFIGRVQYGVGEEALFVQNKR